MRSVMMVFAVLLAVMPEAAAQVRLEPVPADVGSRITDLHHAEGEPGRLYVSDQRGRVHRLDNGTSTVFLDIEDRVAESESEGGILSFAFHPDYEANGTLFVHYIAGLPQRNVIARFTRSSSDPSVADPDSETILLEVEQPGIDHNGGSIAFGPDGYLYIALGDGKCCGDPFEQAQDRSTLLGSMLRLDADSTSGDLNYGIPPDNPFVGNTEGWREEIWAYGFRNPWRFSFDSATGDLWLGDVGQDAWEEVDLVTAGGNYGWPVLEGTHCFDPPEGCDTDGFTPPIWEYPHDENLNVSVIGGYVYRGTAIPELYGRYLYGDYLSGRLWALHYDPATGTTTNTEVADAEAFLVSLGVDGAGEVYAVFHLGTIFKLVPRKVSAEEDVGRDRLHVATYPNPFASSATVAFTLERPMPVEVTLYDGIGRVVRTLAEGPRAAGSHDVRVRADGLPSGVYFVEVRTEEGREVQPITLVR